MEQDNNFDESAWLSRLANRDRVAFQEFFVRFYNCFVLFAMKYVKTKDSAEDVVQDIFYSLLSRPQNFPSIISLKSWFYTAIHNKCLDLYRRNRLRQQYYDEIQHTEDFTFMNNVLEEEINWTLQNFLDKLPEKTREVYKLVIQGYENENICKILEMTMDAVKSHKKRGKAVLLRLGLKNKFS